MPRATRRQRLAFDRHQVFILVLGAVMLASFVLLVLWPKQRELSAVGSAVEHERDLVEQKVLATRTGQYMTAQIPELRKIWPAVERRLPSEPRLLEFLHAMAEQLDADPQLLHEVHCEDGLVNGPVPGVSLRLRLVGPFASVQRAIAAIERSPRLCQFRRTRVARADGGQVEAEAEVVVYYLPPQSAPAQPVASAGGGASPGERAPGIRPGGEGAGG